MRVCNCDVCRVGPSWQRQTTEANQLPAWLVLRNGVHGVLLPRSLQAHARVSRARVAGCRLFVRTLTLAGRTLSWEAVMAAKLSTRQVSREVVALPTHTGVPGKPAQQGGQLANVSKLRRLTPKGPGSPTCELNGLRPGPSPVADCTGVGSEVIGGRIF